MAPWTRSPRYLVFVLAAVVTLLYLFGSFSAPPLQRITHIEDPDLPNRLAHSGRIYQKVLADRQGLIKKMGPNRTRHRVVSRQRTSISSLYSVGISCPRHSTVLLKFNAWAPSAMEARKWVCGITRVETKPDCTVYSFGINLESSFEAEILANTDHCQIWGYDFSVNSFGPEIPSSQTHRTHFRPYGLAGTDRHGPDDVPQMYTIETLMKMNGHTHIDILKVDIERYEFETLSAFIKPYIASGKPLPFGQLQLEIHLWELSFSEFLSWWEMLEEAGLRPFWTEPNLVYQNYNRDRGSELAEYSFLNIKGDNIFIKDPKTPFACGCRARPACTRADTRSLDSIDIRTSKRSWIADSCSKLLASFAIVLQTVF
ncbi:hypothetical protein MSAN_01847900 [Mycena sanguinolenta]|uniref:Methyltransferase domain-containing protein n=1 Tax=Mycena sanguinolenta TaxID=230812 RepID=A0A8H7CQA3_9AGAR|nr:hypothetical protein MSAN_01847900 [Mycena sanguinolenta]